MAQLLPRFVRDQLERIKDEHKLEQIILEAGDVPDDMRRVRRRADDNRARARGIPIVGRVSGGGASPGTDQVGALLRSERGRRR